MARQPKIGLDFAGWKVDVLDNDTKIGRLIEAQGIAAFTVYFYLCQHAYATHGYYLDWDYSYCAMTARKLGKGASAEFVKNVVDMCFQCSLFDKGLFEQCGVLTSRGIQRRYFAAVQNRVSIHKSKEFWLLKPEECQGFDLCTQNSNFPPRNSTKEKKRKQKDIIQKSNTTRALFQPPTVEEVKAYCEERKNGIDPERFHDYYTANGWVQGKGKPIKDWKACVRTWERTERKSTEQTGEISQETSEYERMVESYVPRYRKKGEQS